MIDASGQTAVRRGAGISPLTGCLISLAVGAGAVACLVLILQLTLRGDVILGGGSTNETRVWLIREDTNQGIGVSRSTTGASAEAMAQCTQLTVRFYLWRSDGDYPPITTCSCASGDGAVQLEGPCPP